LPAVVMNINAGHSAVRHIVGMVGMVGAVSSTPCGAL
jgi:hypothetical protein